MGSQTFTYTGAVQTFTVPTGVSQMTMKCWAAEGGGGSPGQGGYTEGVVPVTEGDTLNIYVGGAGGVTAGGWPGGGTGGSPGSGGGGGGRSGVRVNGTTNADQVIAAGGGGGTGNGSGGAGGDGGPDIGAGGANGSGTYNGLGGGGGTQSAGGSGGGTNNGGADPGASGSRNSGGDGGDFTGDTSLNTARGGGAGGAGYYGGGGGGGASNTSGAGGGGGGSCWIVSTATTTTMTRGARVGDGEVQLSWEDPPAAPTSADATYVSDDQLDLTIDGDTTGATIDNYDVEIQRDGGTWVDPSGGPVTPAYRADPQTESYGPGSDNPYNTQVGIDSSFRFRVRAQNSAGSSAWTYSDTVYTTPAPPKDPSITRPNDSTIRIHYTVGTDVHDYMRVFVREDTGAGYAWSHLQNIFNSNSGPVVSGDPTLKGSAVTLEFVVGTAYQSHTLSDDARYQFRMSETRRGNAATIHGPYTYADYGNSGNVYFEDGFETGDTTAWDVVNNMSGTLAVTSTPSGTYTDGSAPEGTYCLEMRWDDYVEKSLGDLSGETDVVVKLYYAIGSMDALDDDFRLWFYDGAAWQTITEWHWEYNRQGWLEASYDVPDAHLNADSRIRIGGESNDGTGDFAFIDRVVVSDVLHEYTDPDDPTGLSLDASTDRQITASWTNNADFHNTVVFWNGAGDYTANRDYLAGGTASHTDTALLDGEGYEYKVQASVDQYRRGALSSTFTSGTSPLATATTNLPVPTALGIANIGPGGGDLSWTDNANNEDGYRALVTRSQQSFEGGFGSWTAGSWVASSAQAHDGAESAYADGVGTGAMESAATTLPTGQMVVDERVYLPTAPTTGNQHIIAYRESGVGWSGPHVSIRNGTLQYNDGAWHDSGYALPAGEWVRLAAYIDIANQWFSVMAVDSAGVHQAIKGAPFIGQSTFLAGDVRNMYYANTVEAHLDSIREYTDTESSVLANTATTTLAGLLNGEQYHVVLAGYTEDTGVLDD